MARRIPLVEDLAAIPGRLEAAVGDLLIPDWALGGFGDRERPVPLDRVVEIEIDLSAWERYLPDVADPEVEGGAI